ncbi:MAG: secretion system protein E [Candidatus Methanomethylicota archaeon]|uniref:Secretion system protein E n=2 Tax=Thermoproteota archaeon TaxID=2056631 RepID=A0A497ETG8_9CREN|nr:MAG: secretion system protein E [Candidatus Verstraetearchaeota archaeon]
MVALSKLAKLFKREVSKVAALEVDAKLEVEKEVSSRVESFDGLVQWYWLDKPYAAVAVVKRDGLYSYNVVTPALSFNELEVLNRVYYRLVDKLCVLREDAHKAFEREALKLIKAYLPGVDKVSCEKLLYYLRRKVFGFDVLDPIFKDVMVEDIACNGPDLPVFVYHMGYGFVKTNIALPQDYLDDYVCHLAELTGHTLSAGSPFVEASLPDGSRLTAFWRKELCDRGTSFSIRKFRYEPLTPLDLIRLNTFSIDSIALLWLLVESGANMLVVGGTASGKTTTLNALCLFIPENRRVVSIEDTRELKLYHDNWIPLIAREDRQVEGSSERMGSMFLLKRALRMRPEYLLVGEVRGKEARIMFQAMNTGHIVYSTIHAGSAEEAFIRLTNPPISVPPAMMLPLDIVIVQALTQREGKDVRRCLFIAEVEEVSASQGFVKLSPIYSYDLSSDSLIPVGQPKKAIKKACIRLGFSESQFFEEFEARKACLYKALLRGVSKVDDFLKLVRSYRRGLIV